MFIKPAVILALALASLGLAAARSPLNDGTCAGCSEEVRDCINLGDATRLDIHASRNASFRAWLRVHQRHALRKLTVSALGNEPRVAF